MEIIKWTGSNLSDVSDILGHRSLLYAEDQLFIQEGNKKIVVNKGDRIFIYRDEVKTIDKNTYELVYTRNYDSYDQKVFKEQTEKLKLECKIITADQIRKYIEKRGWRKLYTTSEMDLYLNDKYLLSEIQVFKIDASDYHEAVYRTIEALSLIEQRLCEQIFKEMKEL